MGSRRLELGRSRPLGAMLLACGRCGASVHLEGAAFCCRCGASLPAVDEYEN